MKGSHTVEWFLDWLEVQKSFPFRTKIQLKKQVKAAADQASTLGKPVVMPITSRNKTVAAMRFFDDGSMEFGYPEGVKWAAGKKPMWIPPPESEF